MQISFYKLDFDVFFFYFIATAIISTLYLLLYISLVEKTLTETYY